MADNISYVYRLYTETRDNLPALVARYFPGATLLQAIGIWKGETELATVIEIVATDDDLQQIVFLADAIKHENAQSSVLVTWQSVGRLDV